MLAYMQPGHSQHLILSIYCLQKCSSIATVELLILAVFVAHKGHFHICGGFIC